MIRADSIDCRQEGCGAKVGKPCGLDPKPAQLSVFLLATPAMREAHRNGATNDVPWYHFTRLDTARGKGRFNGATETRW